MVITCAANRFGCFKSKSSAFSWHIMTDSSCGISEISAFISVVLPLAPFPVKSIPFPKSAASFKILISSSGIVFPNIPAFFKSSSVYFSLGIFRIAIRVILESATMADNTVIRNIKSLWSLSVNVWMAFAVPRFTLFRSNIFVTNRL